jgi:hypothetical protein
MCCFGFTCPSGIFPSEKTKFGFSSKLENSFLQGFPGLAKITKNALPEVLFTQAYLP